MILLVFSYDEINTVFLILMSTKWIITIDKTIILVSASDGHTSRNTQC